MKTIRILVLMLVLPFYGLAQEGGKVKWAFSAKKLDGQIFEFSAKAVVTEGWHIYAQNSGEGSMPTVFTFTANSAIVLDGKVVEQGKVFAKRNELMESELKYYEDSVVFVQKVKVSSLATPSLPKGARELTGKVEFMACDDQMCLPPEEVKFKIELK